MKLLITGAIIFLSGCYSVKQDQQILNKPKIPADLSQINHAKSIFIEDDWIGYADITPVQRHYRLNIQEKTVDANIYTAVGGYGYGDIRQQKTRKIQLSPGIVRDFLSSLSKTSLTVGRKSVDFKKDDFPQINITIQLANDQITIKSISAQDHHVPWSIYWRSLNQEYTTNSPVPFMALSKLRPYLEDRQIAEYIKRQRQKIK
jgi:hypothetical protein